MKNLEPNRGKKLEMIVSGRSYLRYPIRTHTVTDKDDIAKVVREYASQHIQPFDIVVLSERVVAITQGRMIPIEKIHPRLFSHILSRFVSKHPGGIGLGSPWTMEMALQEVGVGRVLFSALLASLVRPFGVRGLFYKLAGGDINAIDGPTDYTLPPGNKSVTLGPSNPQKVVDELSQEFNAIFAIVDANDYGVRTMVCSEQRKGAFIERVLKDNPMGQANERTPMAIVRQV